MKKRALGKQGLEVSELGLGCMGMTWSYGKADETDCLRTLHRSLELGINFWDTAECYGPFLNEELLAKAYKGIREKVVIATKVAWKEGRAAKENLDGSRKQILHAVEGCLKRLNTTYIDLLYLHRLDPKIPVEESVGALAELVEAGKVKYIGLSEVGPNTIRRAHAVHPITALQSEYSLWETGVEEKILPTLRELGIGLVPFSPVGRGFLTGKIKSPNDFSENDFRRLLPRFQKENFEENIELVREVQQLAKKKQATASQIALAWLLQKGPDIVPIPGTTNVKHLEENAKAVDIHLSHQDLAEIEGTLAKITIAGSRYTPAMSSMVSAD